MILRCGTAVVAGRDGRHVDRTGVDEAVQFLLVFGRRDLLVQLFGKQNDNMSIREMHTTDVKCCKQYKSHYAATSGQVALTWHA